MHHGRLQPKHVVSGHIVHPSPKCCLTIDFLFVLPLLRCFSCLHQWWSITMQTDFRTILTEHRLSHLQRLRYQLQRNANPCSITISNFTILHPFNRLFSRKTWVSQYQKGRTILDFNETKDDGWQWHQLDHMQIICTSLQTDNHTSTSSLNFTGRMLFLMPNQKCQSTDRNFTILATKIKTRHGATHTTQQGC